MAPCLANRLSPSLCPRIQADISAGGDCHRNRLVDFATKHMKHTGEFYSLIMLCTTGMMFLASAGELISLYVALELSTISLYILAAFLKKDLKSTEAGLKYLILGAASSGILLYGLSLLYGLTGSTVLDEIGYRLFLNEAPQSPLYLLS